MEEIWKDINGFEGLYQVSNFGRIKSLPKTRKTGKSKKTIRFYDEKILKASSCSNNGYKIVTLSDNGKQKYFTIHRLVCFHFLENKNNYKVINHKDGNKLNNDVENLEWCTNSQNSSHAYKLGLQKGAFVSGSKNISSKKVLKISDGKIFDSIKEAHQESNLKIRYETFCKKINNNNLNDYKKIKS